MAHNLEGDYVEWKHVQKIILIFSTAYLPLLLKTIDYLLINTKNDVIVHE